MALLGPSGCGKSTTMNIIAGMESPSAGRVFVDGVDVSQTPMGKRGVGFVFQNYAIFHSYDRAPEPGLWLEDAPAAQDRDR